MDSSYSFQSNIMMDDSITPTPPVDAHNCNSISDVQGIVVTNPPREESLLDDFRNKAGIRFPKTLKISMNNADNESINIVSKFLDYANSHGGFNGCWVFGKKVVFLKNVLAHQFQYDGIFST